MNFRSRLALAISATTFLTFGGAFLAVSLTFHRAQLRELDEIALEAARSDARQIVAAARENHEPLRVNDELLTAGDADPTPLIRYEVLYDSNDHALSQSRAMASCGKLDVPQAPFRAPVDLRCGPLDLRGTFVHLPDHPELRLFLSVSRKELDEDAGFLFRTMALALLVAMGAATLVTLRVVRTLTRDHDAIASAARLVAGGDLGARAAVNSTDTDLVQLAHDINEMIARLDLMVKSQQRFLAYAAHELRSPLTALYGELSHACRKERSAPEYKEAILEALDATRRLKTLAEDLLAIARLGSETPPPEEKVSLDALVRRLVREVARSAEARGVVLEVDAEELTVLGREQDLGRLLRNLLDNAIRHTESGKRVFVRCKREGEKATLRVEDEGPGVEPQERDKLFEPFYRSVTSREREGAGAGLGLPIVKEIARTHRGDVWFDASYTQGAAFVVELPLPPATAKAPPSVRTVSA